MDQVDAYADELKAQGVSGSAFVHKMKAKMAELGCRNYGQWRCRVKGPVRPPKKSCPKPVKPAPKKCIIRH